jgi:predicted adenylyl cyclase CyaB
MSSPLSRNLELKARCAGLDEVRAVVRRLGARPAGTLRQVDTFFRAPHGRLKLRVPDDGPAELIWYDRPDLPGPRASHYHLVQIQDPSGLESALAAALGVRGKVHKRRELFLWDNVRIHLDDVQGLGEFVEFEAVLRSEEEAVRAEAQLAQLVAALGIRPADQLATAYADLLGL